MNEIFRRKSRSGDLPKNARLVGVIGRQFILTDADAFDRSFTLSATQFQEIYGGDPTPPESEQEALNRAAARDHAEALDAYRRPDSKPDDVAGIRKLVERQGRSPETPEERFERADDDHI